jgi:hypothetical protein
MLMLLPPACHPERSAEASKASRHAQSKDPYSVSYPRAVSWNSLRGVVKKLLDVPLTPSTGKGSFDSASAFALAPLRMTTQLRTDHKNRPPTRPYALPVIWLVVSPFSC